MNESIATESSGTALQPGADLESPRVAAKERMWSDFLVEGADGILRGGEVHPLGYLLIRHGLLQSPDAVQLEPVEGLRHLSPSKVYE